MKKLSLALLAIALGLSAGCAQAYTHTFINTLPYNVVFSAYYVSGLCRDFKNNWIAPQGEENDRIDHSAGACCLDRVEAYVVSWTDKERKNTKKEPMDSYSPPHDFLDNCLSLTLIFRERKNPKQGQARWYIANKAEEDATERENDQRRRQGLPLINPG